MTTASAGRTDKGSSRGSRAFRAPLQRARLAVSGQGRGEANHKGQTTAPALESEEADMNSHSEIAEPRTAAEIIARYRDVRRRLSFSRHSVKASGEPRSPNRSCHLQGARHDPRALPRARTPASRNSLSISHSGPRGPSSGFDPNPRANRRNSRPQPAATDRRRSSRGGLARPPGHRLVIATLGKVFQTRSHDRAALDPRDERALGPRSRTARLHGRLVITGNSRLHALLPPFPVRANVHEPSRDERRRQGWLPLAPAARTRVRRGAPARSARPCSATASRSAGRAGAKRSPRPDSRAPVLKRKERP